MVDDELTLNRKVIEDLFTHAQHGDVVSFLKLHASDACLVDPVFGCLSGLDLRSFISRQFSLLHQFNVRHTVLDIGLCSSVVRLAVSARDSSVQGGDGFEMDACVITRDGIVLRHEIEFDVANWARTMLPGVHLYRGILPGWRRHLSARAHRLFLGP